MYGYTGKLLYVNLTTKELEIKDLSENLARSFIGGHGLGAKILYDEMKADTPVFSEESLLGFLSGSLNNTGGFFGGRYMVVSKSPVSRGINDANSGGFFGTAMKKAGFDGVIVRGISETPVYIFLDNGRAEIRDASHIWGKTVVDCEQTLKKEIGDSTIGVASIGPGGEAMSFMAGIFNDEHRTAARGGSGAVMGSKKLKAVVARGHQTVELYDKAAMTDISRKIASDLRDGAKKGAMNALGRFGTGGNMVASVLGGDASIRNWKSTGLECFPEERAVKLSKPTYDDEFKIRKYNCSQCPLGCGAVYTVGDSKWLLKHIGRPEYEILGAFGPQMLNDDIKTVLYCNHICNEYGLDAISVGSTVAWAMECYDEGLLTKEDLDGVELKWGDADAIAEVTERICRNEGNTAKLLLNGSQYAADLLGAGHEFLSTAGGIEIPQHDPRNSPGYGRPYISDPTPGRHVKGGLGAIDKGSPNRYDYRMTGFRDAMSTAGDELSACAGYCKFFGTGANASYKIPIITAAHGYRFTKAEEYFTGLRIFFIRQAFNLREGIKRGDFDLKPRLYGIPPLESGPYAGITWDGERLVDNFYNTIGCDVNGVPYKAMLEMIGGLDDVIEDLYASK